MSIMKTNNVRKYSIITAVVLCAITITLAIILSAVGNPTTNNNGNIEQPVDTKPIVFINPLGVMEVLKGYSATELQYSATLKQWQVHKALDLAATEGTDVLAVYDGVVESIKTNYMMGTTITIKHNDKLKTVYSSLNEEVNVAVGDSIKKGKIIGKVANTAQSEAADGAHLHFEVWADGNLVDPQNYVMLENK